MTVYLLDDEPVFPHPSLADDDGLLAVGGDLSTERLLAAYSNGIFPWFNPGENIFWWAPDPRFILYPEKFKISKSFRQFLNKHDYDIGFNQQFKKVIKQCRRIKRNDQQGTWITTEMEKAYIALHEQGFSVSVEISNKGRLVAGLYGILTPRVFCGESMFHTQSNTGKLALFALVEFCKKSGVEIIDVQMHTPFFEEIGAEYITLSEYLHILHGQE